MGDPCDGDSARACGDVQSERSADGPRPARRTFWILPLAYFIRDTPLVSSAVESSLRQMDASLEDAARGLGASWLLTMRRVILPAARPGLVAGGLLAAVTAVGEFVASVVLYTHSNRPISMEILVQLRALALGTAARSE